MKKNRRIIVLLIVLLVAVATASFGVLQTLDKRAEKSSGQATTDATEQAAKDQTDDDSAQNGSKETDIESEEGSAYPLATLFFASDYQAEPGFDEPSATLSRILDAAEADGKSINRVVMCGDYTNDRVLHDYQLSPDESIAEILEVATEKCPAIGIEKETYGESNGTTNKENAGVGEEAPAAGNTVAAENEAAAEKAPAAANVLFVQGNHDRMSQM